MKSGSIGELWLLVRGFTVLVQLFTILLNARTNRLENGVLQVGTPASVVNAAPAHTVLLHFVSCFDMRSLWS